ncbi:MAG: sulfite exporter TauE/SafE family protein, partial [Chromatiaceae bacterium]
MTVLAIAALVTFALTTVFSMAGLGAALILIPVFMAFGVEVHSAMATALLLNALGMSVASSTFVRKGLVEWRLVVPMLVVAVSLSPVGVWAAHGLERTPLLWLFLGFLVFAAAMMLFYSPKPRAARA